MPINSQQYTLGDWVLKANFLQNPARKFSTHGPKKACKDNNFSENGLSTKCRSFNKLKLKTIYTEIIYCTNCIYF